jgi:predicted Abi (CAAX) family protease
MPFIILLITIAVSLCFWLIVKIQKSSNSTHQKQVSNYSLSIQDRWNQPDFYPGDRIVTDTHYKPIGCWIGRLILPTRLIRNLNDDVVKFEVYYAPTESAYLIGKVVNLTWNNSSDVKDFVRAVTRNIQFNRETEISQNMGYVLPDRLNDREQVGPLESLAGSRTQDDVVVKLELPIGIDNRPQLLDSEEIEVDVTLTIDRPPVQITGRFMGLVSILKRVDSVDNSLEERLHQKFEVRHYNRASQQFDGAVEIVRIPQVRADRNGITRSKIDRLEYSPFNSSGWYIYGAQDVEGTFVVQAIEPRVITKLVPDEVHLGRPAALNYIDRLNWQNTEAQKGTAKTVLLDPTVSNEPELTTDWHEGDRALVMHIYGGIGGEKAEATAPFGIVTGHFAYGIARIVRDPFTDELRFDIEYCQIYAHNPDGIISGTATWANYMGDLQRGWLGSRPVSDVIIRLDCITEDYNFDGIRLSPLTQLQQQLEEMMARYRHGDGDGAALVTPVTSCVQDSNQALYIAIQRLEQQVARQPQILDWLQQHPNHPQTLRFERLQALGNALEKLLVPLGIVRPDWERNARKLAGITPPPNLFRAAYKTATSWRTMLPRFAYDEIARVFLKNGAKLWFIRTNQVGGFDPDIVPKAPTRLLS